MATRLLFFAIALGIAVGLLAPNGTTQPQAAPPAAQVATLSRTAPAMMTMPGEVVLQRQPNGHFYLDATVNGQLVHFVVDTGASMVALTSDDARRVGLAFSPSEFMVIGRGASGDVHGKPVLLDRVAIGNNEARDIRAAIIDDGLDVSLLGQSFLSRIASVTIRDDRMILR